MFFVYYFGLLFLTFVVNGQPDHYSEELTITPSNGYLVSHFRFVTTRSAPLENKFFDLFPKVIGELILKYNLEEFHLSLVQGLWRPTLWGYPPNPSPGPTGAELWGWFHNDSNIETKWRDLIHALSGLFCASLTQMESKLSVPPEFSHRPTGVISNVTNAVRYAALPSENVCTENLTPWKKLLPCKGDRGLRSLLNPLRLYNAHYHALGVHVRRVCPQKSCKNPSWELSQNLIVVFRREKLNLVDIFGAKIGPPCVLASSSKVLVDLNGLDEHDVSYKPNSSVSVGGKHLSFDLKQYNTGSVPNIKVEFKKTALSANDLLNFHCYLAGKGQQHGKIVCQLSNSSPNEIPIIYFHVIPWFLRIYHHTFQVSCNTTSAPMKTLNYQPARFRSRPHFIESFFKVPPSSLCFFSMYFEKSLLRWTEYPPDAHHGFFSPAPAVIFKPIREEKEHVTLHGEILLVNLPTPDFSMPYNVICLVCTVVALAFGPIHNLTTKRMVLKTSEELQKKSWKEKVRRGLSESLKRIKSKFGKKTEEHAKEE